MNKKAFKTVLCATVLLFVAMFAVVGIMASYLFGYTPEQRDPASETVIRYDPDNNPIVMKETEAAEYNFLVLGHDRAAVLTDVIMLVNYDVTSGSVSILQFPRDTYVSYGVDTAKINATYSSFYHEFKYKGESDPELKALRKFADILEEALCTKINYCTIMNLDGFGNIVDAIGGVELTVPARMVYNDPWQNLYIDLYPGYQTLYGNEAEQFVRFRYGYTNGDLGREDAQKIFMSAFIKKAKETVTISKLTEIGQILVDNVYTDLTVSDVVYFGKNLLNIDMSKIKMKTIPTGVVSSGHLVVNRKELLNIVNESFNVYDQMIPDAFFDPHLTFCNAYNQEHINNYYADNWVYGGEEYNAGDVNENSINIPRSY